MISDLCHQLSTYDIKQTVVQPDFNDNNTLIDSISKHMTIIDLGEIAISHPFFSLINFLYVIKKHHALTETMDVYLKLKAHCFKPFNLDKKDLSDAIALARTLFFVYAALANDRLMCACDNTKFTGAFKQQGRLRPSLKALIERCIDIKREKEKP